ncbi:C-8 sterol isomerase [Wickerhamiella sorbophila]|uniref:C-8 sterol isomerase n=1 Tax=Wickerhamiella sorbophila TaxID=45607 RepID=A0A2T0FME5_9ASCO|nr:C-8 sterol isomerase [Wickerhamiella sorbophila]PRT56149.1 C-8 sterol isomerase [Wickerhamiella sorbophila]
MNLTKLALILPLLFVTVRVMDYARLTFLPAFYIFDKVRLQQICQEALASLDIDAPAQKIMEKTHTLLKKEYPEFIVDELRPEDWVFNNAGNAMGSMIILHASLTEYLIFFGSAIGTEGHTGTHFADDYFTILHGVQYAARPNASIAEKYLPGDQHHMPYGVNKQYSIPAGSFALELAQGYIPSMLPFGMIEVLTSTLDVASFAQTCVLTAKHMFGNILKGKI